MTYQLHKGDCLDVMQERLQPSSVDLILADLPYGTTTMEWDSVIDLPTLWRRYASRLAPGGCIVLFGSQPFTSRLIISNPDWFKYELIWDKNKCGSPGLAKIRPMKTHENILVFAPGKTVYNPQMESGEPYFRKGAAKVRANNHGYGFKIGNAIGKSGTRYPKAVRNISRDFSAKKQVHPPQKPVPLLEWLIATYSHAGQVVLDNAMGSGSTGVAAMNLNREFIGIEKDEEYFDIAQQRIMEAHDANGGDLV